MSRWRSLCGACGTRKADNEQGSRQAAILERIEAALQRQSDLMQGEETLVATPGGTVHRPDCPIVAGKDGLRRVAASEPGLEPCRMCEPDYQPLAEPEPAGRSRR